MIKRMHDLFSGNTPEAQAARVAVERRERTEKELAKEREKSGFRKDMPLHRTYFHDISQPAKIPGELEKLVDVTASAENKWLNGWSAAATFEGEFSKVTTSYAGKGVVRYSW